MPNLTWIGLGNMGRGMCSNLVTKGNLSAPLTIYNRTTSRAEALSSKLNESHPSSSKVAHDIPSAIADADIIFTCLGDDPAMLATVSAFLSSGVDLKSKIFVDCSTIHPDTTTKIETDLTNAGASFAAMPVFGAPAMADAGQLICVLSGPATVTEKIKPYTTGVLGRAIIDYTDCPPKQSTTLKLLGNTFVFNMVQTLAEGHVVAEKLGLGPENLHKFVELMFPGPYTAYSGRMLSGDYYQRAEPLFQVDLARKDAGHAMKLAESVGARFRLTEIADEYLKVVKEEMGAKGDIAGIYGAVRVGNGLGFGNKEKVE